MHTTQRKRKKREHANRNSKIMFKLVLEGLLAKIICFGKKNSEHQKHFRVYIIMFESMNSSGVVKK